MSDNDNNANLTTYCIFKYISQCINDKDEDTPDFIGTHNEMLNKANEIKNQMLNNDKYYGFQITYLNENFNRKSSHINNLQSLSYNNKMQLDYYTAMPFQDCVNLLSTNLQSLLRRSESNHHSDLYSKACSETHGYQSAE